SPAPPLWRDAPCAALVPGHHRTGRERRPPEHHRRQGRPQPLGREGPCGARPSHTRCGGKRPPVRGSAMTPVDHPHGGGEGKSKGGRHPVTPWGVPTLGKRTRAKHKESNKLIVRSRRRGKEGRR